ncbi:dynein light chain, putative [Plasmodium ovale]|uniref:Dynein light chain, putative n=1 Tax=Plasmodium ovale TaxID=36330 RepID=A0A1C3KT70_PLAOA|nr:dynein light chain, putative [Plasmodium ovale]
MPTWLMKTDIINSLKTLVKGDLKNSLLNTDDKEEITKNICSLIKNRLKVLTSDKYKIIVEVLLNENKGQGINVSTRLFYNKQSDFFFKESIDNEICYCFVVVYLIHV